MKKIRAWATVLCLALSVGCASAPPSVVTIAAPSKSRAELFGAAQRAVASLGYDVKSTNEAAGLITAFRPMTGMFAKPGYGHNITLEIDAGGVKVTAFPMQGVTGGESPEKIRKQVEDAIRKVLN